MIVVCGEALIDRIGGLNSPGGGPFNTARALARLGTFHLVTLAWVNQRATQKRMEVATSAMASAHNSQQAAAVHGTTVKALGMTGAMVDRQLGQIDRLPTGISHAQEQ